MGRPVGGREPVAQQPQLGKLMPLRDRKMLCMPQGFREWFRGEVWPGEQWPGREAENVVLGAVVERVGFDVSAGKLEGLRRCWRVAAAQHDVADLWERIDNDAPNDVFRAQFDAYDAACVAAAKDAVAAWEL